MPDTLLNLVAVSQSIIQAPTSIPTADHKRGGFRHHGRDNVREDGHRLRGDDEYFPARVEGHFGADMGTTGAQG